MDSPSERIGFGAGTAGFTAEASTSAVSWPAIIAGAFVAASASLILLTLGAGFGLAAASPWSNVGASAPAFTVAAGIWFIVVQWIASGTGGYLTGRLRTKWVNTHTHEVFFRDTAQGFLTWAVATVIGVSILASGVSSAISGAVRGTATLASGAAQGAAQSGGSPAGGYEIDSLFRSGRPDASPSTAEMRPEAARILVKGIANGDVPPADRAYLAQIVTARTGLSDADAQKRVDDVIAQLKAAEVKVKEAADAARKTASAVSIFTALSLLIGAFIACAASALGGKERDAHP